MKVTISKMTLQQERLAYRRAVLSSLQVFFELSPKQAKTLVDGWWERMGKSEVFTSGLFLHDEPINTAADLAKAPYSFVSTDLHLKYAQVIADAMPSARKQRKPLKKASLASRAA